VSRRVVMVSWLVLGVLLCAGSVALWPRGGQADLARQRRAAATRTDGTSAGPAVAGRPPAAEDASSAAAEVDPKSPRRHAPIALALSPDRTRAYVVNEGTDSVSVLDIGQRQVLREIPVGRHPSQAVISPDGRTLYVTSRYDYCVQAVDLERGEVVARWPTGYEPLGLALTPDGNSLAIANALSNTVVVLALPSGERRFEIPVGRVPRYLAVTPDGQRLVVGHAQSRDVSIIGLASGRVLEQRLLARSAQLQQVACTADGRYAVVPGLVAHDEMITIQMERGWIVSNGFYVLDLQAQGHFVTLLLDRVLAGAANPWAAAISPDQRRLYVSLAGVHQIAIVDLPATLELVARTTPQQVPRLSQDVEIMERLGLVQRVDPGVIGPRAIALNADAGELLVAGYFSDSVSVLDAETGEVRAAIPLGPATPLSLWRQGQSLFSDARICYQNWYSCASCHQEDGTTDSLNWDLINDGTGNPKNVKSMHDGILTPPAMWSGVRGDQDTAVMAGQRFLGFLPDQEVQKALMEYIGNPRRAPNPYRLLDPPAIERGRKVFFRARCDACHTPPLFVDLKQHDVGLSGFTSEADFRSRFDTPSLRECYRTAPYLHDGRAATLHDVLTVHNPRNEHGMTRGLTSGERDDLVAYLRSL
jgi:YVTN family beta-propeller protein